jgi:hypothetical protein
MLIHSQGQIEIWQFVGFYLVFGIRDGGDAVACPSPGMAWEIASA